MRIFTRLAVGLMALSSSLALSAPRTFEEVFRAAVARNEGVQQEEQRIAQADARVAQARGAIFPNIGLNLSHQIQQEPPSLAVREFSPAQQTSSSLTVTQPLFKGFREFFGLSQLQHQRDSQKAMRLFAQLRTYQEVAQNYLQILGLEQDLRNLEEQSQIYQKRVQELTARARIGESGEHDLVSAQATQAALFAETRLVEGQLEVARELFHFLSGLEKGTQLVDPKFTKSAEPLENYLRQVEKRPDIAAAREQWEAARQAVSVAWGGHAPSVDAVGNYYLLRPGFFSDIKWDISLRLTLPLFEGGSTQARVSEAVAKRKEAELGLERARRAARQEIASLFQRVEARVDHVSKLKHSLELSKKNTELLQRDYRRGLTRNIDVQLSLTEYRTAQRTFDQAHYAAELELVQLRVAAAMVPLPSEEQGE